jgi:hypothetical protein
MLHGERELTVGYQSKFQSLEVTSADIMTWITTPHSGRIKHAADKLFTAAIVGGKWDNYTTVTASLGCWIENAFGHHEESNSKDGLAIIGGDIHGGRLNEHVRSIHFLIFEIDGSLSLRAGYEALERAACMAIVWTTYSHHKTKTQVGLGSYRNWHRKVFGAPADPSSDELAARFAAETKRLRHLRGVKLHRAGRQRSTREYGKTVRVFDLEHAREDRYRVVIPLAEPFSILDHGEDHYRRLYHTAGERIFGPGSHSVESANPARIQYLPARAPGSPFEPPVIFDEELLDWRKIELPAQAAPSIEKRGWRAGDMARVGQGASFSELRHVLKSIPVDLPYPEWFKCLGAIHHETRGEGRLLAHEWSAGDPRYSEHEVDMIWDALDPAHPRPANLGTLINFAKEYDRNYAPHKTRLVAPKRFL